MHFIWEKFLCEAVGQVPVLTVLHFFFYCFDYVIWQVRFLYLFSFFIEFNDLSNTVHFSLVCLFYLHFWLTPFIKNLSSLSIHTPFFYFIVWKPEVFWKSNQNLKKQGHWSLGHFFSLMIYSLPGKTLGSFRHIPSTIVNLAA